MNHFADLDLFQNQLQNAVVHTVRQLSEVANPSFGQIAYLRPENEEDQYQTGFYQHNGTTWEKLYTKNEVDEIIKRSQHITILMKCRLRYLQENINKAYPDYDEERDSVEYSGNYKILTLNFYKREYDLTADMELRYPAFLTYNLSDNMKIIRLNISNAVMNSDAEEELEFVITYQWSE